MALEMTAGSSSVGITTALISSGELNPCAVAMGDKEDSRAVRATRPARIRWTSLIYPDGGGVGSQ